MIPRGKPDQGLRFGFGIFAENLDIGAFNADEGENSEGMEFDHLTSIGEAPAPARYEVE